MSLPGDKSVGRLLKSDEVKSILEQEFRTSKLITVISAYVTSPAIEWLVRNISPAVEVRLVARLSPHDFLSGASSLDAVRTALEANFRVGIIDNLHAKIYSIDQRKIFVGSANFTTNGLKLFGEGNLEAVVEAEASKENLLFVDQILKSAAPIDSATLLKMAAFLKDASTQKNAPGLSNLASWPDNVVPKSADLWVHDLPWVNLSEEQVSVEGMLHDQLLFSVEDDGGKSFNDSKVFRWLITMLDGKPSKEMYFGEITANLHNQLKDDPRPYRKDIKQLVVNLLSYCQKHSVKYISIDTPSYSQRVRLLTN